MKRKMIMDREDVASLSETIDIQNFTFNPMKKKPIILHLLFSLSARKYVFFDLLSSSSYL